MGTLSAVLNRLLLPPGLILVLLLVAILLVLLRRRRAALVTASVGCALVVILSLGPVARALLAPLEGRYGVLAAGDPRVEGARAIVLLSGGVVDDEQLSAVALDRAVAAFLRHRELGLPIITTGGSPWPGAAAEADVLARVLLSLGVPDDAIRRESTSRTTWENAVKVRDLGPDGPLILITSAIHMWRAVASFRAAGLDVVPAPAGRLLGRARPGLAAWLPDAESLGASLVALHEYLGLVGYRLVYGVSLSER